MFAWRGKMVTLLNLLTGPIPMRPETRSDSYFQKPKDTKSDESADGNDNAEGNKDEHDDNL